MVTTTQGINMEVNPTEETEDRRPSSVSFNNSENKNIDSSSPKVPKKFINNWKQACDRTKDRTKELLKKWRTLPESGQSDHINSPGPQSMDCNTGNNNTNWSEHIWSEYQTDFSVSINSTKRLSITDNQHQTPNKMIPATWVKRSPSGDEGYKNSPTLSNLTDTQKKKFEHFFIAYLDLDSDDVISLADFDAFSERLRHFADWSKSSAEYHRLKEVQRGFIETFLLPEDLDKPIHSYDSLERKIKKVQLSQEQWLDKWNTILTQCQNFYELPFWLQYFPKILYHIINKSGTGSITKEELSAFFSSLLGLTTIQIAPFIEEAFAILTSNNQHPLTYSVYRLSFANFLFGRHPNGPGQCLFGPIKGMETHFFPIDYKLLNSAPEEREHYSPKVKSNRLSVVV